MSAKLVLPHITTGLIAVGCVLTVIATASNYWIAEEVLGMKSHAGLWVDCVGIGDTMKCSSEKGEGDMFFNAVKAFMVMACVAYGVVISYIITMQFRTELSPKILGALTLFTSLLSFVAVVVFTAKLGSNVSYSWSYALAWCGQIITFVAGLLVFFVSSNYETLE